VAVDALSYNHTRVYCFHHIGVAGCRIHRMFAWRTVNCIIRIYLDSEHFFVQIWPCPLEEKFCKSTTFAIIDRRHRSSCLPDVAGMMGL
jgi:hypothetical protein